jgi:hypothetical protein
VCVIVWSLVRKSGPSERYFCPEAIRAIVLCLVPHACMILSVRNKGKDSLGGGEKMILTWEIDAVCAALSRPPCSVSTRSILLACVCEKRGSVVFVFFVFKFARMVFVFFSPAHDDDGESMTDVNTY